jgi:hypothetical protein
MENTENWLVFNPTTQRKKSVAYFERMFMFAVLPILEALIV